MDEMMTQDELDRMADWLRSRADRLERDEPYAVNQIEALRTAADEVDAAGSEDEIAAV